MPFGAAAQGGAAFFFSLSGTTVRGVLLNHVIWVAYHVAILTRKTVAGRSFPIQNFYGSIAPYWHNLTRGEGAPKALSLLPSLLQSPFTALSSAEPAYQGLSNEMSAPSPLAVLTA